MKQLNLILIFIFSVFWRFQTSYAMECFDIDKTVDVIVVGAGISGLAAARELQTAGKEVLVIEADDRIGGRIWSIDPWGSTLELGASWIHGIANNPVGDLAKKLNLKIITTQYNHKCLNCRFSSLTLYDTNGKKIDEATMNILKDFAEQFMRFLAEIGKNTAYQHLSVEQAMVKFQEAKKVPPNLQRAFRYMVVLMITFEQAGDLNDMSVLETDTYTEHGSHGDNVIFAQGYNQITEYLAKGLHIILNERVNKISYTTENVLVGTQAGKIYKARHVIVTIPLGVLKKKEVTFDPPLPEDKVSAISQLEMGLMNKTYLFFPCVFWDEESEWIGYVPEEKSKEAIDILNLKKFMNQPILLVFTAGSFAKEVENWNDQKIIAYIMNILRKMYGDKIPEPSSHVITRWGKDPFSYGSYSFMSFSAKPNVFQVMAQPVGPTLFFAGEAASKFEGSTVYGAYMSGVDSAKQILNLKTEVGNAKLNLTPNN
jgi:monoamine oxidase